MKKSFLIVLSFVMVLILIGCGNQGSNSTSGQEQSSEFTSSIQSTEMTSAVESTENKEVSYYPIRIQTGGEEVVIEKRPENVAVFNYDIAEIMAALGLADEIKIFRGGHQSLDAILPEYRDALQGIKDTDEISSDKGFPSLEVMLNLEPDLIIMPSYYFNVEVFGKREDYKNNDIKVYMTEGTYVPNCTIENTYNDIINIGKIFNVNEKAEALVQNMKERIAAVEKKMDGKKKIKVLAFDMEINGNAVSWGGIGLANHLLKLAGGENVFAGVEKQFPHVSWEEFVNADPDLIIIDVYGDDASNGQDKIDFLKNNPQTAEMRAVKENRIVTIPLFSIFPSLQNANMIEHISDEILNLQ